MLSQQPLIVKYQNSPKEQALDIAVNKLYINAHYHRMITKYKGDKK